MVFKVENSGLKILSSFHDCSDTLYAWGTVLQQCVWISGLHCEVPWSWFFGDTEFSRVHVNGTNRTEVWERVKSYVSCTGIKEIHLRIALFFEEMVLQKVLTAK